MKQKFLNITYNIALIALFAGLLDLLARVFPIIGIFQGLPYKDRLFLAFWFTLTFFIVIVKLRDKYFADVAVRDLPAKAKALGYSFLATDVWFNVTFGPALFLFQLANTYGEGWTFTAHCKAIKRYTEAKIKSGKVLTPVEISRYWLCENFYGKVLNLGEKGHYSKRKY